MFGNRYGHGSFGCNQRGGFCNTNKPNAELYGNVNSVSRIEVRTLLRIDLFLDDQYFIYRDLF